MLISRVLISENESLETFQAFRRHRLNVFRLVKSRDLSDGNDPPPHLGNSSCLD